MNNLTIVPTEQSHLDNITKIEAACFSSPWSRQSFATTIANNYTSCCSAIIDNEVVGYICLSHLFEEGEILNIAVSPTFRKWGIGEALMDFGIDYLKKQGITRITLEVRESNTPAKTLYLKKGFTPIAIRKNYYNLPLENGIVMEKNI